MGPSHKHDDHWLAEITFTKQNEWTVNAEILGGFEFLFCTDCRKKNTPHTYTPFVESFGRFFVVFSSYPFVFERKKEKRNSETLIQMNHSNTTKRNKKRRKKPWLYCYIIVTKVRSPAAHSSMLLANRIQDTKFFG